MTESKYALIIGLLLHIWGSVVDVIWLSVVLHIIATITLIISIISLYYER